jgi:C1A family cysteine protease/alpha-D-ribose 1-methylphosphonate 5-triphosphate synthase subunit PhnH
MVFGGLSMKELPVRVFRILAIFLVLAFFLPPALAVPAADKGEPKIQEAPVNPVYQGSVNGVKAGYSIKENGKERGLGYLASPVDKSHLKGLKIKKNVGLLALDPVEGSGDAGILSFPATFDLRTLGRVSPVKDQGSCGSCWAFATYGSGESTTLPGALYDFSENNLKNAAGFDYGSCAGGNADMSAAYLARWAGPVSEASDPYVASSTTSPAGLPAVRHPQEIYYLPARASATDNDNIKTALQAYGAVYSAFYYTGTSFNSGTQSYYYSGSSGSNHAIAIVGWDDAYPATKFSAAPAGNGAFIVKNSWGSSWGSGGYFYLSYYDTNIGKDNAVFTSEVTTNYDRVYQYDPLGWTSGLGYGSDTASFANVYTAAASENLAAVSFYTPGGNANYQVSVYLNPTSGPINPAGAATTLSGTIPLPGYHTIPLSTPVALTSGQKFSIVVRLQTPGYNYPVSLESPISGYSSAATSAAGQSYISSAGTTWTDLTSYYTGRNVCVKGFTKSGVVVTNPVPTLSSLNPSSATAGTAAFSLAVTGGNFVSGSVVRWNGNNLVTTYTSATQLSGAVPAAYIASAGTASITVFNPAPGGGTSGALTFTINAAPNPVPALASLSPASTAAGSPAFTMTVDGSNFVATSKVYWKGAQRTTRYVSATRLSADVLSTDVQSADTASVTVTNPAPGGGTSGTATFTVTTANNPVPTLNVISPSSATAGGAGFTLTATGTNFVAGSKIRWNGADRTTTYVSPTTLTASIVQADIGTAGTASVTVFNPTPGGGTSGALTFTINPAGNPVPTLSTISPSSKTAGDPGFTLTVTGTNFIAGSKVRWNGNDRTTTYVSATQLTASIPSTDIQTAGSVPVTVFNPAPGGGTSASKTFTISAPASVKAAFSGTPTSGKAPLAVKFTDASTGSPTSWSWNFGDGTTATIQHPSHSYAKTGYYTVTLTVTNGASSNSVVKSSYIIVRKGASIKIHN